MNDNELNNPQDPREPESQREMSVNQYGRTKDPAVVVEEAGRTVLLTPDETLIFEKHPSIDIVPKNRPRSIYAGMWGRNEIATVTLGIFALLTVAIVYVFLVRPSDNELALHKIEVEALTAEQQTASQNFGAATSTETKVSNVLTSEENFEASFLPPESSGRNALYQRLNGLIDAYGLVNTAGPDYAPLETVDQEKTNNSSSDENRGRDRFRSIFPGLFVTMTVEGSYQNLRRFIREMESGREFVIISAVQLEPSDNEKSSNQQSAPTIQQPQQQQFPQQPGFNRFPSNPVPQGPIYVAPRGKTHGDVVSLHLEMAAYFRRPNFEPVAAQ